MPKMSQMNFTNAIATPLCLLTLLGSCASRWGGGGGTVVDAETKQPLSGVPVAIYLSTSSASILPHGNAVPYCGPQYYTTSDANGKFSIPENALDLPWRFSFYPINVSLHAVAFKAGYVDSRDIEGIRFDGYTNIKTGPLKVSFEMRKDTGSLWKRYEWLGERTRVGCSCSDMHTAILKERKEIYQPALDAEYLRMNGGKPLARGQIVAPRLGTVGAKSCP